MRLTGLGSIAGSRFTSPTQGMTVTSTVTYNTTWVEAATIRYTFKVVFAVTDKPNANGLLFEKGGSADGLGVSFDSAGQKMKFGFGAGSATESTNNMIMEVAYSSIPSGYHEWVFACQEISNVMKGVIYRNGNVVLSRSKSGNPSWAAGSDDGGFGLQGGSSLTPAVSSSALAGVTVSGSLFTYHNVKPSTFDTD